MNNCYPVTATSINAYWAHGLLFLTAEGHAECSQYVFISQSPLTVFPPLYQLLTCECTVIGSLPYRAHAWFYLAEKPETVTVYTASGPQEVAVVAFPAELVEGVPTPSVLTDEPAEGEVVGVSLNVVDTDLAINDAVGKLQRLYPGEVNARVTESGVVATGWPTAVALYYVKMRQAGQPRKTDESAPAKEADAGTESAEAAPKSERRSRR